MSRGLSSNQLKILGVAYHSNRITQRGIPGVKGALVQEDSKQVNTFVSDHSGPKDINWMLAAVVVYGAELNREFGVALNPYFGLWLPSMPVRRNNGIPIRVGGLKSNRLTSIKPNTIRNISNLVRRGLLASAPDNTIAREGYVLTPQGYELGELHEVNFDPLLYLECRTLIAPDGNFHKDAMFFHLIEVAREHSLDTALEQLVDFKSIGSGQSLDEVARQREWIIARIEKWQRRWCDKYGTH